MRPRGQTPRMPEGAEAEAEGADRFNEAAGADPADAQAARQSTDKNLKNRFNEAAGADPADAHRTTEVDRFVAPRQLQ